MFWNKKKIEYGSNLGKKCYITIEEMKLEPKYLGGYRWIATCPLCKHDFIFSLKNIYSNWCSHCLATVKIYD